ncbi:AAA family ATPase [Arcicella sp. LKC2W]|uniref:AAA family ATPase n=1 Tax=Arcicella sp. LKC2W TaxID=2984198 RepID=UPI002B1EC53E|nr:AAA family ATPase [Arcicella sp. LKC2W]MEA5459868.1 AAA family ATPase [Arcicella sp. LKC2W]
MENFRIESLEINKIGAFEHIKMDFPKKTDPDKAEIHILTGENGTGKSTVLEALIESITLKSENVHLNFHKKSHDTEGSFEVKFEACSPAKYIFFGRLFAPVTHIPDFLGSYHTTLEEDNLNSFVQLRPFKTAFFAYSGYRRVTEVKIEGPKKILDNPLQNSLDVNRSINPENLIQWIVNTVTRELSSKGRGDNAKAKVLKETLQNLENIISEIIEEAISFDIDDDFNVFVLKEFRLHFDTLPDGLKSMISWIGDLLMRMDRLKWENDTPIFDRNFILFLDEIEVHLHPAWQRKILPVVQKLFKNAQIFISTHSPFVVGSVDGAWVHKLQKGDDGFAVLDGEPVLSEDGKSVRRILDEVFGINQQYGVEVEKDLARFREIRQQIIMGQTYNSEEFNELVKHLASQSTELEQMMGMEMNQLKRITQKELV